MQNIYLEILISDIKKGVKNEKKLKAIENLEKEILKLEEKNFDLLTAVEGFKDLADRINLEQLK